MNLQTPAPITECRGSRRRQIGHHPWALCHPGRLLLLTVAVLLCAAWPATGPAAAGVPFVPPEAAHIHPAPTITRGPDDLPRIALTFDDNYDLPRAYRALDVLDEMKAPATVFVIGHYQTLGPDLSHRLAADGLEIGDHTRSHADCTTISWRALQIEIGDGTRTFTELTGRPTAPLFRPPGGFTNDVTATAAAAQGFRSVVLWDIDTQDWRGASAAAITDTALSQAHDGAIVLMHLAAPHTAEALPGVISGLRERGYELVTVTELLKGDRRFIDVDPSTAEGQTVLQMVEAGYLSGVDDDYFGPFDPIARVELAEAAVRAAGVPGPAAGDAYYTAAAAAAGLMASPVATTAPDQPLNRLQLAQVLARMARTKGYRPAADSIGASPESSTKATEAVVLADVPAYAIDDVRLVQDLGLMTPADAGRFGGEAPAQRRHTAIVLDRFLALPTVGDSTLGEQGGDDVTGSTGAGLTESAPSDGVRVLGAAMIVGFAVAAALAALRLRAEARRKKARAARRRAPIQGRRQV